MGLIYRFCNRFPRFGIPHLMRVLVFGMGLVYVLGWVDREGGVTSWLFFSSHEILNGQVWRLFSFIFVPTQHNPVWFAVSLFIYYSLGTSLERAWGTAKFNIYVLFNILILAGAGMVIHFAAPAFSFATFLFVNGYFVMTFLIFAFITLSSDSTFHLSFILPIRASWLGLLMGAALIYDLFYSMRFFFPLNFLPFVLLVPYLLFCGGILLGRAPSMQHVQNSKGAFRFKRAVKKIEEDQRKRSYTRKCEVCGKTDATDPDMEFRYCSRCEGYHCFCMDHINNHEHFR